MARPGEPMSSERRIDAIERQAQALELRKAGIDFRTIAGKLGYDGPAGAYQAVKSALKKTLQEPADEYRALHLARHEHIIRANWPAMLRGDEGAARVILAALKSVADLLGLNAPKEIKVNHELLSLADRVADGLSLNPADVLAEAERILVASGTTD